MRALCRLALTVLALTLVSSGSAGAQKLEVKPGLWEFRIGDAATPRQVCYTAEVLAGGIEQFAMPPGFDCQAKVREATARRVAVSISCQGSVALEGETTIETPDSETMVMVSSSTVSFGGQQQKVDATARYKWLGADCGDVKPFDPKQPTQ